MSIAFNYTVKAKCSNCGEIEYSFRDICNETIGTIFIEYILCPKCKNKIVINEVDLSKPYVDSESALHCLTCGEVLTKRIDKIDGFSWLFCKNCAEKGGAK
jgi:uncharacterized Zn finger protein